MSDKPVNIGRDASGMVVATGDKNVLYSEVGVNFARKALPPSSAVDLLKELKQLHLILGRLGREHANKTNRAVGNASEKARKPDPNKDEICSAFKRALDYAAESNSIVEQAGRLAPHLTSALA